MLWLTGLTPLTVVSATVSWTFLLSHSLAHTNSLSLSCQTLLSTGFAHWCPTSIEGTTLDLTCESSLSLSLNVCELGQPCGWPKARTCGPRAQENCVVILQMRAITTSSGGYSRCCPENQDRSISIAHGTKSQVENNASYSLTYMSMYSGARSLDDAPLPPKIIPSSFKPLSSCPHCRYNVLTAQESMGGQRVH